MSKKRTKKDENELTAVEPYTDSELVLDMNNVEVNYLLQKSENFSRRFHNYLVSTGRTKVPETFAD